MGPGDVKGAMIITARRGRSTTAMEETSTATIDTGSTKAGVGPETGAVNGERSEPEPEPESNPESEPESEPSTWWCHKKARDHFGLRRPEPW